MAALESELNTILRWSALIARLFGFATFQRCDAKRALRVSESGGKALCGLAATLSILVVLLRISAPANAQSPWSSVIITSPIVDSIDENHVSIFSGRPQFTIPALKLGDVSYTPFSYNGEHFQQGGLIDHNYGHVALCESVGGINTAGNFECAVAGSLVALQAIYGEERETFELSGGIYTPESSDGATFVDNGSSCTWTKPDGTQIIYVAFHNSGDPRCISNNISKIIYADGRISTYYYYGSFSTTALSPIVSIATNSGYMLKYVYSGTPSFGAQTSVIAFSRAFEACDPASTSCSLSGTWPTATLNWQNITVSPCDNFPSLGPGYNSCTHYIFTIQDSALRNHVFALDSYFRVISYQPPEATAPVYYYSLCSLLSDLTTLRNCFGYTTLPPYSGVFQPQPLMFDLANTVTRNGQTWTYSAFFNPGGGPPAYSYWSHGVTNPLGRTMGASGNATPGLESYYGPTDAVSQYDGTAYQYSRSIANPLYSMTSPGGIVSVYNIYGRYDLHQLTRNPISGSGLSPTVETMNYQYSVSPFTCASVFTCHKPISVVDANGNETDFTYDPAHGGVLTATGPAVSGIHPQTRYTYVQRYAWYLDSSGTMIRDADPIWLPATESYCRNGAASGSGCALANDEVLTTYDYGPDTGPNNLLQRGKAVTADGQTLRTCYGHDHQANKIWETSPNANPASCPAY